MNYIVYMHIAPNNKKYIGITCQKQSSRFQNGNGYRKCTRFFNAIKKYGWKNIEHYILFENLTKEQAEQKEIELIAYYKTDNKKYGYNIEHGGNSVGKLSDETKKKIAISHLGKKASNETREKMSVSHKKENLSSDTINKMISSHIGLKKTEETKKKIGFSNKGKINTPEAIQRMIYAKTSKSKPIIQYDKQGNFVKMWSSASAFEREEKKNKRHIVRCAKHEVETAYGYIWRYEGE